MADHVQFRFTRFLSFMADKEASVHEQFKASNSANGAPASTGRSVVVVALFVLFAQPVFAEAYSIGCSYNPKNPNADQAGAECESFYETYVNNNVSMYNWN
jgi:hypothetical protein